MEKVSKHFAEPCRGFRNRAETNFEKETVAKAGEVDLFFSRRVPIKFQLLFSGLLTLVAALAVVLFSYHLYGKKSTNYDERKRKKPYLVGNIWSRRKFGRFNLKEVEKAEKHGAQGPPGEKMASHCKACGIWYLILAHFFFFIGLVLCNSLNTFPFHYHVRFVFGEWQGSTVSLFS